MARPCPNWNRFLIIRDFSMKIFTLISPVLGIWKVLGPNYIFHHGPIIQIKPKFTILTYSRTCEFLHQFSSWTTESPADHQLLKERFRLYQIIIPWRPFGWIADVYNSSANILKLISFCLQFGLSWLHLYIIYYWIRRKLIC